MRTALFLTIPLIAGCAQAPIDPVTSQQVISTVTDTPPRPDWRLGVDAFASETGGAAVRQSSLEHVVTRKARTTGGAVTDAHGFVTVPLMEVDASTALSPSQSDSDEFERAWRKYCHHKQGMTARDREIIRATAMPARMKDSCNPKSLKK